MGYSELKGVFVTWPGVVSVTVWLGVLMFNADMQSSDLSWKLNGVESRYQIPMTYAFGVQLKDRVLARTARSDTCKITPNATA